MRNTRLLRLELVCLFALLARPLPAQNSFPTSPASAAQENGFASDSPLFLQVRLDHALKLSRLKPGDEVEGKLFHSVYSQDQELFPADSIIHLSVDRMGQRRRTSNSNWPWVIKIFAPRHEKYPTFRFARVSSPRADDVALRTSLISIGEQVEISSGKVSNWNRKSQNKTSAILLASLEAVIPSGRQSPQVLSGYASAAAGETVTIAAKTHARLVLVGGLSASRNHAGDVVQARLVEPIYIDAAVALPEGSLFEGTVVQRVPPRMLITDHRRSSRCAAMVKPE